VNSNDILQLLKEKHSEDVVVPECRTGPSQGRGDEYVIMDCWTAPHSWASYQTTAYEIKVSRADFIRDTKWQRYLPYCHYMYFVAPKGIVNPNELPPEVGLYEPTTNCKRLLMKKRAVYRNVELPVEFYKYLLICRTNIRSDRSVQHSKQAYWKNWLDNCIVDAEFGRHVGQKIAQSVKNEILKVQEANRDLTRINAQLSDVRKQLTDMGLDTKTTHMWDTHRRVREKLEAYKTGLPDELETTLNQLTRLINIVREELCTKKDK
jgi:hypothetical protein